MEDVQPILDDLRAAGLKINELVDLVYKVKDVRPDLPILERWWRQARLYSTKGNLVRAHRRQVWPRSGAVHEATAASGYRASRFAACSLVPRRSWGSPAPTTVADGRFPDDRTRKSQDFGPTEMLCHSAGAWPCRGSCQEGARRRRGVFAGGRRA